MTATTSPSVPAVPVSKLRDSHRLWHLMFKRGGNPRCSVVFEHEGPIQGAIQRARAYCIKMNYIFIHVEEFLHDLDADEKAFLADN